MSLAAPVLCCLLKCIFCFLMRPLIFLVTQGFCGLFPRSILEGNYFPISDSVFFLKVVQRYSVSSDSAFCWNSCRAARNFFFIPSLSAFLYWITFLGGIFDFMGQRLDSIKTDSCSDIPGIVSTLLMRVEFFSGNKLCHDGIRVNNANFH